MAQALPMAVREFVHALFLQGLHHKAIIEETKRQHGVAVRPSVIRQWSARYNWSTTVAQTRTVLERRVSEPILTSQVAKQSQSVREKLADSISHASLLLAKQPARGLKGALAIQEALEPMVRNANKVFGWDQQSSSTIASVQSLSSDLPEPQKLRTPTEETPVLASHNTVDAPVIDTQLSQSHSVTNESAK
jgi:hypothetical protein